MRRPGDTIAGKYVLVRLLGKGGMGSVWQARNVALGTDVAIKLVLPSGVTDEASERLLREAHAAALIDHPGIVRVFDFGRSEEDEPFIVMEMLRGTSLADLFDARGRLPARVAVQLLLPVVSALAEAHARGVVHRDLKPDNVMLVVAPNGCVTPKIVDFGIAKLTREEHRPLTRAGVVMGSPNYMAPEQARGATDVDERADVWALCVLLYEAITGVRPFEAENHLALLYKILTDDPIPTMEFAAGDPDLWSVLQKGLEKPLEKRWASMRQLGVALAEWAAMRQVESDVTGSHIDHHWLSPGRLSAVLELPVPSKRAALPPTEQVLAASNERASAAAPERLPAPAERASTAPAERLPAPLEDTIAPSAELIALYEEAEALLENDVDARADRALTGDAPRAELASGEDLLDAAPRARTAPPAAADEPSEDSPTLAASISDRPPDMPHRLAPPPRRVGLMFAAAVFALTSFGGTWIALSAGGAGGAAAPLAAATAEAASLVVAPVLTASPEQPPQDEPTVEPAPISSAVPTATASAVRSAAPWRPMPGKRKGMPLPSRPDF